MLSKHTVKQLQSSAEDHPLLLLGGALGAGVVLGKLAPQLVAGLLRLGGGLAWKLFVLPALSKRLGEVIDGERPARLGPVDGESLLDLVGLRTRPRAASRALVSGAWLGAGLAAGAGLGLAFAPRPGSELRRELGERLREATRSKAENAALDEPLA